MNKRPLTTYFQLDNHHFLNMLSIFPLYISGFFIKNRVPIGVQIYVQVFSSVPLINMSVYMPMPRCFYYYSSLVLFEIRNGDLHQFFYFFGLFKNTFFLLFHVKWSAVLSKSIKNCIGILTEISFNLYIDFWQNGHFYYTNPTN